MLKNILKIIVIFIFGTAGGIFADQILWPYFVERPLFYKYRLEQAPINITEVKEITITENIALQKTVKKVKNVVVGVRTETKAGEILEGSGLIVTSDGLVVTLAKLVPRNSEFSFYMDGKWGTFQVLKRDLKNNLALIELKETNLSTVGFADFSEVELGERVFLIGVIFKKRGGPKKMVDEGIVKYYDNDEIQTNIFEKSALAGSPLFDIEGKVLGLNQIDSEGKVTAIPISKIREFVGF